MRAEAPAAALAALAPLRQAARDRAAAGAAVPAEPRAGCADPARRVPTAARAARNPVVRPVVVRKARVAPAARPSATDLAMLEPASGAAATAVLPASVVTAMVLVRTRAAAARLASGAAAKAVPPASAVTAMAPVRTRAAAARLASAAAVTAHGMERARARAAVSAVVGLPAAR
ncbi:hypothetical protein [Methylobacterium sp. PvR107]|uniref:hypothetical protein n=1 Tax=Methylobacterium sp. PvR107 TaxID=2806597 RepID=UPI001B3E5783|nr:hypothetical protein [Methylobacterium sp. PvR107]MBP1179710.1 hypothetical protein [Methylobacterium sp. PvR107]